MGANSTHPAALETGAPRPALLLFSDTDALYDDMLAAIAGARHRVWMETYIFAADEVGWAFAEALAARARAGVDVRLRVDSAGALETPYSKRIRRHFHQAGVELRWFNRLRRLVPAQINHRDHRKLLLVDEQSVYIGSSNILWSNSTRLCGDSCTHQLDMLVDGARLPHIIASATALWQQLEEDSNRWQPLSAGASQLVPNSPHNRQRPLRSLYQALFEQARSTIQLAVAFFVPDPDTVYAIECAARRGVDVSLILPRYTDMPAARWAAHAWYARLLAAGVRIYEYLPSILHAKAAVVDSSWAVLGSGNFDYRSFFLNHELNLETRDAAFCRELQQVLVHTSTRCEEITREAWAQRPWSARAREKLIWPARRLL